MRSGLVAFIKFVKFCHTVRLHLTGRLGSKACRRCFLVRFPDLGFWGLIICFRFMFSIYRTSGVGVCVCKKMGYEQCRNPSA